MMGSPVADDEHLYVGAYKSNQATDVYILCLSASDGKLLWNTKIGSYKNDPRQQFYYSAFRTTVPSLLLAGGALYVETHAGSLVQMNPAKGEINWGINYDSDTPSTDRYYNQPPEQLTMSAPQLIDGVLYFKGMRSRRLYAIDPAAPKVLWSRPIAMSSVLVGADRERVYLGGPEITAYDLKTQQLIWSLQVPLGTGWTTPLLTDDRIYQFSPRGIYEIDKRSGEVLQLLRGSDMDSLGGNLLLTPKALVAVSNVAITAYPIEKPSDDKAGTKN
jgi:outer membrane protein assembly factor BamB